MLEKNLKRGLFASDLGNEGKIYMEENESDCHMPIGESQLINQTTELLWQIHEGTL